MAGYAIAHLEEIAELDDGREPYRPVRHHFGIRSFGVNAWTGRAVGARILNEHDEAEDGGHEELYLVTHGRATFELDGERRDAPAGTFVFVERGVERTAFAEEAGTVVVAVGGRPGEAYEPVGWELWAPIDPLYRAGDYDGAAERGRALADANPQYAGLAYNTACCESLAGRPAEAVEYLRRAIEASERFRAYAKGDTDFDPIRDEPGFQELVGT
jgi:tetratricopeptide (TPR) repeat protein